MAPFGLTDQYKSSAVAKEVLEMSVNKCPILVIGGTGRTGQSLVNAIIERKESFDVATLSRRESASNPAVERLKSLGVEIRLGDFARDSVATLADTLAGVDILISTVPAGEILNQKNILRAAKQAGVRRVIPCDFGTACSPGRRALYDEKLEIRALIRELGLQYTFIDVGIWTQVVLPQPSSNKSWFGGISRQIFGAGDIKSAITDLTDVGRFVRRILEDPRTVNKYVFCWADHVSQDDVYKVANRVGGENFSDIKVHLSEEEVQRLAIEGKEKFTREGGERAYAQWVFYEYMYSMYIDGANTLENAKAQDALDARELYPDFIPITLEESAKTFYANVPDFDVEA